MLKVEKIDVWGFEHAIRGMRNPLNSWDRSDSDVAFHALENFSPDDENADKYRELNDKYGLNLKIGPNDMGLMKRLFNAGTEHRKYLRQIFVSMDITAPLYWWKEFDTYKVGTTANSCSTMHKIASKDLTLDDFSVDHLTTTNKECLEVLLDNFNYHRKKFVEEGNKEDWWQLIQLLPTSFNQKRTVTLNYENVICMIKQRTGHKLDEWHVLVDEFKKLPYVEDLLGE